MASTFAELVVGGVLMAPFVTYLALALVVILAGAAINSPRLRPPCSNSCETASPQSWFKAKWHCNYV